MSELRMPDPFDFHQINAVILVVPNWTLSKDVRLKVLMNVG